MRTFVRKGGGNVKDLIDQLTDNSSARFLQGQDSRKPGFSRARFLQSQVLQSQAFQSQVSPEPGCPKPGSSTARSSHFLQGEDSIRAN